jgi:hypothetical protein
MEPTPQSPRWFAAGFGANENQQSSAMYTVRIEKIDMGLDGFFARTKGFLP